ncbi:Enolase-phosphatase e1 [Thalictrum thalictroides]|uniref:Enolase-phosphatase e1 n=1 Tax=Thalictrum thalictroides TaxID=46969 RepID=A0A7J6UZF9_THATH|nr:Enolase-phosphatase e1 [Thalictrum thalictroides]
MALLFQLPLVTPFPKPYFIHKSLKCTDSASLFFKDYRLRNVRSVIYSHGINAYRSNLSEFRAECYQYQFKDAMKLYALGFDRSFPSHGPLHKGESYDYKNGRRVVKARALHESAFQPSQRYILLDIEGTTTPISFVTDVLFPYARNNARKHLSATYDTEETKTDIKLLRAQVEDDLKQGVIGAIPIPTEDAGKEEMISSLVANVEGMIKADRKITALKQLQVYIYSSGSIEAQKLIFGNSNYGDLRKFLCGFFDTTIGNKKEARSYLEISQSLGVNSPAEILFFTDVYQEAIAAKEAGLEVIISVRPGNGPLPENHGFKTIESFVEILDPI